MNAKVALHFVQLGAHLSAERVNVRKQAFQNVEEFQRHAAGERAAAEGRAVHARPDGRGGLLVRHNDAQRQAARERFGRYHDIRQDHRFGQLISEIATGPAHAALNFVENQERVESGGKLAGLARVLDAQRDHATLALYALDHNAGRALADGGFERGRVVGRNEFHAGEQRLEVLAVFGLAGNGERAERAPVERVFQRDNLELLRRDLAAVGTHHLQGALHGFGAGVREESALQSADFG